MNRLFELHLYYMLYEHGRYLLCCLYLLYLLYLLLLYNSATYILCRLYWQEPVATSVRFPTWDQYVRGSNPRLARHWYLCQDMKLMLTSALAFYEVLQKFLRYVVAHGP